MGSCATGRASRGPSGSGRASVFVQVSGSLQAGLDLVDQLDLRACYAFYAGRADLLRRLARPDDAVVAHRIAVALAPGTAERDFLSAQAQVLRQRP